MVLALSRASAIGLLLLGLAACDRAEPANNQAAAARVPVDARPRATLLIDRRGEAMPDAVFTLPDGETTRLADFRGRPVLVNLWATWCAPCVKEMPTLDALAARTEGQLHVLAVSQDIKDRPAVDQWFARADLKHLEPLHDQPNALGQHYGTGMLPTTVLYDADGREVWRVIGEMDWNGARAAVLLAEVLG